jgi:hypothetical protein
VVLVAAFLMLRFMAMVPPAGTTELGGSTGILNRFICRSINLVDGGKVIANENTIPVFATGQVDVMSGSVASS